MRDSRLQKFAQVLVNHSLKLKEGEKVLIEMIDIPNEVGLALLEEISKVGGIPLLEAKSQRLQRSLYINGSEDFFKLAADCELHRMKQMDCYIAVRGIANDKELIDVPGDKMSMYEQLWLKPVHFQERVPNTRWVVTRYPSVSYAQKGKMSTEEFENFFFNVCTGIDWEKASSAMDALAAYMEKTDRVHLVGNGTDLTFSIKGLPAIKCAGEHNIPDGEVFTAPVRDSVNGVIAYNAQSSYRGFTFENIKLTFKDGKIVEATANDTKRINEIFDSDEGARYVGEFAVGTHPFIDRPMDDILFDEKIGGSIHFTPGAAYDDCNNSNKSAIHWDLVLIQTEEYGGGELWFDDVLVRRDGIFIVDELKGLNKENLVV